MLDWQKKNLVTPSQQLNLAWGEQHRSSLQVGSASVRKHSLRNIDQVRDHAWHIPAMPAPSTLRPTYALLRRSQQTTDYVVWWLTEPGHLPTPLLLGEAMTKLRASKKRAEMFCSKGCKHDGKKADVYLCLEHQNRLPLAELHSELQGGNCCFLCSFSAWNFTASSIAASACLKASVGAPFSS